MTIEFYSERADVPAGLSEMLEKVARACVEAEGVVEEVVLAVDWVCPGS